MYASRQKELEKLMNIMSNLNEKLQLLQKDIPNNINNKSSQLVSYIEEEINMNIKSIKELENPFLLFIIGSGNYGKSTLINALLKDTVIETSDLPNTWKLDLFIKSEKEKLEISYTDERKIIKSIESGKRIIKEEEEKFKISKKEISKNILSQKNKINKDKLKELKKQQEKLYLYKSDIDEIKYYLKNKDILENFIIVDTPGLNQTLLKNTTHRMKKYYQKSDGVIWIIDAQNIISKETNNLIEEINKIDSIHEKKIIGVVNKIDIIKDEKDLKRIKNKVSEIYKDRLDDIIYISAKEALNGFINKDKELINKSNIKSLYKSIDINFKYVCEESQINSKYKNISIMKYNLLDKVHSYKRNLYKDISIYNEVSFELNKSCDEIYLYTLKHIEAFKKKRIYTQEDLNILKKAVENLEKQCSKDLDKIYNTLIKKADFTKTTNNFINTNVYFSTSKYLIINYNYNNSINTKNHKKISNFFNKFTNSNTSKLANDEIKLSSYIYKNITNLEDEIIFTLKSKLESIKENINTIKYNTFKEKYVDYSLIKNHIDYLNNIENILINLR